MTARRAAALAVLAVLALAAAGARADDPLPDVVLLQAGVPVQSEVEADGYADFKVATPPAPAGGAEVVPLTVTVTPLTEGDPDLFMSLTTTRPRDQVGGFNESARGFSEDTITTAQYAPDSFVYFSVFGWDARSDFTIVANFREAIHLVDGVPQSGDAKYEETVHYVLHLDETHANENLTITATPLNGNPRVLVSTQQMPEDSDPDSYTWSTQRAASGEPLVILGGSDPNWPGDATNVTVYIAVVGDSATTFSLVAATTVAPTLLRDGIPQQGRGSSGGAVYYKADLPREGCEFDVVVTPITGDPDLFVSRSVPHPGPGTNDTRRSRSSTGDDRVAYLNADPGPFYVAVVPFGARDATWTVTAFSDCGDEHNEDFSTLISGVPQRAEVAEGDVRLYRISVRNLTAAGGLDISVSRRYGDPDLYVLADGNSSDAGVASVPGPSNYSWASSSYGEDTLSIVPSDDGFVDTGTYNIAVYGYSNASFSIVAIVRGEEQLLQNGRSFRRDLMNGTSEYFTVPVDRADLDLTVTVTELGVGDPDLFVSTEPRPTRENAMWSGQRLRGDSVTIPHDDPRAEACHQQMAAGRPCRFYVMVYAAQSTSYTIVASFEEETFLQPGLPQQGQVVSGATKYYQVQFEENAGMDVTLTAQSLGGSVDLYVSTTGEPSPEESMWHSAWYSSRQTVVVRADDPNRCATPECRYHLGVRGFTNATFTVLATSANRTIPLLLGEPQEEHVPANGFEFFSFRVLEPGLDLAFAVTPLSGDPDMWVSEPSAVDGDGAVVDDGTAAGQHNNPRPRGANSSTAHSRMFGADLLTFADAAVGTYYIGVEAFTEATFTVTAAASRTNREDRHWVVDLGNGVPQAGFVFEQRNHYYRLFVPEPAEGVPHRRLVVTVTKTWGDADLFVSRLNDTGADGGAAGEDDFPTMETATWKSTSYAEDRVEVLDPQPGTYIIGVFGYTAAAYTVTGVTSAANTRLQSGVPVRAQLTVEEGDAETYDFYDLDVSTTQADITFVVTPLLGTPQLFASFGRNRTGDSPKRGGAHTFWHQFDSRDDAGTMSLTITSDDPDRCVDPQGCVYHLGITSTHDTTYTVVAYTSDDTQSLQEGVPQSGHVGNGTTVFYTVQVPVETGLDMTVNVEAVTGRPVTYVTEDPHRLPGPGTWDAQLDWRSDRPYTGRPLVIRSEERVGCGADTAGGANASCVYHIGVYGDEVDSDFSITVTSQGANTVLQNGVAARGHVDAVADEAKRYKYYEFRVLGDTGQRVVFSLTSLTGDADMFESSTLQRPGREADKHDHKATSYGDDVIVITDAQPGDYFLSVYAYENSTFTVMAYLDYAMDPNATQTLVRGQPQAGVAAANEVSYYSVAVEHAHTDLTVSLSPSGGDPDLYIGFPNGGRPGTNEGEYLAKAAESGADLLVLSNPEAGRYTLAVHCYAHDCSFTIVATTQDSLTALRDGVPVRDVLTTPGETEYFYIDATGVQPGQSLSVEVTALNGDPDLYVSSNTTKPDANNNEGMARSYRDDAVTIPYDRLVPGATYYIAVQAFSNCTFYVTASFQNTTQLLAGVPQGGRVDYSEQKYYTLRAEGAGRLTVALTPFVGNAHVYVSATDAVPDHGDPNSYQWSSISSTSAQFLTISFDDPNFKPNAVYKIMVRGRGSGGGQGVCFYSLTAATEHAQLQSGVPLHAAVSTDQFAYFRMDVAGDVDEVQVSVTPLSGDPDLYVSMSNPRPNNTAYDAFSSNWGADALTLTPADDFWTPSGTVYVAVYAWTNCTFVLTVEAHSAEVNETVVLINGVPQVNEITNNSASAGGGVDRYTFQPSTDLDGDDFDIDFSVSLRHGDADIYVATRNWSVTNGELTRTNYEWAGRDWGQDELVIRHDDPGFCRSCLYDVLIHAFTVPTLYSVTAKTSDAVTLLENGVPVVETVEGGSYALYQISVLETGRRLELRVSSNSGGGDPDLFVGFDTEEEPDEAQHSPTVSTAHWRSRSFGDDALTIGGAGGDPLLPGRYWIAVYGAGSGSTFTLTATLTGANDPGQRDATALEDGIPQTGEVAATEEARYRFSVVGGNTHNFNSLTVTLTTSSGDTSAFMDTGDSWPSADTARWQTHGNGTTVRGVVSIHRADLGQCINRDTSDGQPVCEFHIVVRGSDNAPTSQFTIVFLTEESSQLLRDGSAVQGHIARDELRHYEYPLQIPGPRATRPDVSVILTPYWGSAMLYASTTVPRPGAPADQHSWASVPDSDTPSITVPGGELRANDTVLYVTVEGKQPGAYVLTASSASAELSEGYGQDASGPIGDAPTAEHHYRFTVTGPHTADKEIRLALVAGEGAGAAAATFDMYFSWASSAQKSPVQPTPQNSEWHVMGVESGKVMVISTQGERAPHQPCSDCDTLLITVVAASAFRITAYSEFAPPILSDREFWVDTVAVDDYQYYELPVAVTNKLVVQAVPCRGDVELYVSTKGLLPREGHADIHASQGIIKTIDIEASTDLASVVVGVRGRAGTSAPGEEVLFRILAEFAGEAVQPLSLPPTGGQLTVASPQRGVVTIEFEQVALPDTHSAEDVTYRVYGKLRDAGAGVVMGTVCGIESADAGVLLSLAVVQGSADQDKLTVTIDEGIVPGSTYSINVLARVRALDGDASRDPDRNKVVYRESTVKVLSDGTGGGGAPIGTILAIGIPVAIFVVCLVSYLCVRNRKMKKELDVEMHDVPKKAVLKATRGPPGARAADGEPANKATKKYSRLLGVDDEEEDEDGYTDYDPPAMDVRL